MDRNLREPSGPEVVEVISECSRLLRKFYQTSHDVLIFPGVGSGGLEAAVVNTCSPGDAVLAVTMGVQGDRFAKAAEVFGVDVRRLSVPRGKAVEPEQLETALDEHGDVSAVLLTYNELSTGVLNPLTELAPLVKQQGKFLMVDASSALGAVPIQTDELGLDVVVTQSQPEWGMEPGLVMLSVASTAWAVAQRSRLPRYYWDFGRARYWQEKGVGPYSAAWPLLTALRDGLRRMDEEGLGQLQVLHEQASWEAREGAKALGLQLFADERYASPSGTALRVPTGADPEDLLRRLTAHGDVAIAGGQAEMAGRVLRIPHLGFDGPERVRKALQALADVLQDIPAESTS